MKFEIPKSCMISISKHAKIEKLEGKYVLVANPFPQF